MWQVLSLLAAAAVASRLGAFSASRANSSAASVDAPLAYGHAFSRPDDFTDHQIESIAQRFDMFTVEKKTAQNKYGAKSSLAATIGTAQRIKAVNSNVKVLMYWNAAIHYNCYECESEVQAEWVKPNGKYDYSKPAFRAWWVQCAIDSIKNSERTLLPDGDSMRMLDGLFLDAAPQVWKREKQNWLTMVGEIREALGEDAILVNNGFYLSGKRPAKNGNKLAGESAWKASGITYIESLSKTTSLQRELFHLRWIAQASADNPTLRMIGRGEISKQAEMAGQVKDDDPEFKFGLAKFLIVVNSVKQSWFLATRNYDINLVNVGQLQQPILEGLGCGEPTASFETNGFVLTRSFEGGTVTVDIQAGTASIICNFDQS